MFHLLVYGSSIYLTGISTLLSCDPELQILLCSSFAELGNTNQFNAVLIDLHDPTVRDALQLLRTRPNLRIIGLDSATGTLVDISRQVHYTHTLQDLLDHIKNPVP